MVHSEIILVVTWLVALKSKRLAADEATAAIFLVFMVRPHSNSIGQRSMLDSNQLEQACFWREAYLVLNLLYFSTAKCLLQIHCALFNTYNLIIIKKFEFLKVYKCINFFRIFSLINILELFHV